MRLALPSLPTHSGGRFSRFTLPSRRRRSPARRALQATTKAAKGGAILKATRFAARRTRTAVAFPLLTLGALVMFLRKRLRSRREGTFDGAVSPPSPVAQTPRPAAADPSPSNPETDLPTAPNGASMTDAQRATAKAAVADRDAPNEGAPGHEPS